MPFTFDPVPDINAVAYFRRKGWEPGFSFEDVWKEAHQVSFTVAKAMELDVLADLRFALDEAIAEGTTFAQFKRDLTPTLQRLGWWGRQLRADPLTGQVASVQLGSPRRLKIIYDANLRTARTSGQWRRIQDSLDTHPYLLYRLGPSREHRPEHVRWDGLMLPATDPWWRSHNPPNGWGCRCRVRQVSRVEARRTRRRVDTAPAIRRRRYVNKRTGQAELVPIGIDPGWNYNPGSDRLASGRTLLDAKRAATAKRFGVDLPVIAMPPGLA